MKPKVTIHDTDTTEEVQAKLQYALNAAKPQHSPLPWKEIDGMIQAQDGEFVSNVDGVCDPKTQQANAAFIVQSVNRALLFDELLIAVKDYAFDLTQEDASGPVLDGLEDLIARAEAVK